MESDNYNDVMQEVKEAYADCWLNWSEGQHRRNLSFRASRPVPSSVAAEIMASAVPGGYNEFEADLLNNIQGDVVIAREGSVCIYAMPGAKIPKSLNEDERSTDGKETRLWWD